jgi:hypothetical protein
MDRKLAQRRVDSDEGLPKIAGEGHREIRGATISRAKQLRSLRPEVECANTNQRREPDGGRDRKDHLEATA